MSCESVRKWRVRFLKGQLGTGSGGPSASSRTSSAGGLAPIPSKTPRDHSTRHNGPPDIRLVNLATRSSHNQPSQAKRHWIGFEPASSPVHPHALTRSSLRVSGSSSHAVGPSTSCMAVMALRM